MDGNNRPRTVSDCSQKVKIIGGVVIFLSALTMVLYLGSPKPEVMHELLAMQYALSQAFVFCGAWGIATGIGLLRAWRWARTSMLVFGSLITACGLGLLLMLLFMPAGDIDDRSLIRMKAIVFLPFVILTGLGALFLIYFTRSNVKSYFQSR